MSLAVGSNGASSVVQAATTHSLMLQPIFSLPAVDKFNEAKTRGMGPPQFGAMHSAAKPLAALRDRSPERKKPKPSVSPWQIATGDTQMPPLAVKQPSAGPQRPSLMPAVARFGRPAATQSSAVGNARWLQADKVRKSRGLYVSNPIVHRAASNILANTYAQK